MSKSRYDKPIPYGWYAVEYSNKLEKGEVKPLSYFGRELVLFRTESGKASMLDAYCPHLGAHLGHGGIVKGESVSCPFHAWKFDGNGMCTDVPYAKRTPPKVKDKQCIRHYEVVERNEMIWAWYHPYDAAPLFEVEVIPEIGAEGWTDMDTYEWTIPTIIQETGENAADLAHFVTVHGRPTVPDGVVTLEGHRRCTMFDSEANKVQQDGSVEHGKGGFETAKLESYSIGPGQTYQRFSRLFDIVMMATITPIDDQNLQLRFNFTLPVGQSEAQNVYARGFRDEVVHQLEQDIPIWVHKKYLDRPILCDGDGPIGQYRRWFQQFYAEFQPEAKAEVRKEKELIATD
ncbi:Rieske 2Fe-2S domain-containing protein [Endozoicomonas montiporae]|uniref:cholesterol 7-desaturase n=1 Tax=Endozoicomonas montiporae CL-33 TaxID=570277 RepID=A0A142BDC5_9GAMM|nr:Rieske 2Fe-2S domain-containing protein [Endozoicomonas montiporae]AMO56751.1 Rieske (2Fe-2S) domain ring-hydroxylating dioxygenase [Endozoicomonas montiporae CL-33]